MASVEIVEVFSAYEDAQFKVEASALRQIAKAELGMIEPVELNIFTKTILATALQREQIVRNDALQTAMNGNGDWKSAMRNVAAVTELMEKFGIDDSQWSPNGASKEPVTEVPKKDAEAPPTGKTMSLNLDGQMETPL